MTDSRPEAAGIDEKTLEEIADRLYDDDMTTAERSALCLRLIAALRLAMKERDDAEDAAHYNCMKKHEHIEQIGALAERLALAEKERDNGELAIIRLKRDVTELQERLVLADSVVAAARGVQCESLSRKFDGNWKLVEVKTCGECVGCRVAEALADFDKGAKT